MSNEFNPIAIRDRIKEIDAITTECANERAKLVEALRIEGFVLVGDSCSGAATIQDPSNWRAGDVVRCTQASHFFTVGKEYEIGGDSDFDGAIMVKDNDGDPMWRFPQDFEFVRRPN